MDPTAKTMRAKCGTGQKAVGSTCVRALAVAEVAINPRATEELGYAASALLRYPQALREVAEAANAVLTHRKEKP